MNNNCSWVPIPKNHRDISHSFLEDLKDLPVFSFREDFIMNNVGASIEGSIHILFSTDSQLMSPFKRNEECFKITRAKFQFEMH